MSSPERGGRKPNGRSSIYLGRDGRWHGWVTMGIKPNGSPDRRHRTGATETEVTKKVRKLEAERDAGKPSRPGKRMKVAPWMRHYIENVAPQRVSQGTIDSTYRPKAENWVIPMLGHHWLDQLCSDHLYKFYAALRKEGLAPNTILQIHRILSRALKIAVREGRIGVNPCTLIDAPQYAEPETETLTAEEARKLINLTADRRNGSRWLVALALGLRQNESLGLRWTYLDLDHAVMRIHWQLSHDRYRHGCEDPHECGAKHHVYPCPPDCSKAKRVSGRKHYCRKPCRANCSQHDGKCPKFCAADCTEHAKACPQRVGGIKFTRPKGKRKRAIPIPAQLLPVLRAHKAAQQAEREAAGAAWREWDLVWCQPDGQPIDTHDDWDEWKALLSEAAIKDVRLHDARHTAGTLLGELHVDLHVIQRILGHAQVSTTRIYTDPTDPLTREAADRIGGLLLPDAEPEPLDPERQRLADELKHALAEYDKLRDAGAEVPAPITQVMDAIRAYREASLGGEDT